jgi:hemophore-related protein
MSDITVRRGLFGVFAGFALGGVAAATIALPTATAAPAACTASGLANTSSSVLGAAGQYLDTHPDANQALTDAGSQSGPQAEASVRGYFTAHPQEWTDLQAIARPLTDMSRQCNAQASPGQIATLFQALSA